MLSEITPDLHTAVGQMRFPGGVVLPVRMTVVRLPSGDLVVHAPLAPQPPLFDAVTKLGPVKHIIAPNCLHHLFVGPWQQRFPDAVAHGAPGLRDKRPDLRWGTDLGADGAAPWADVLDSTIVAGAPRLNEIVFHHRPSRSLLVTDLLFNMTDPVNLPTRLVLALAGTRGRLAMSRVWRRYCRGHTNRLNLRDSVRRMLDWDFTRILPGHGAVFSADDAQGQARKALSWALAD
jgi:hypothetical protein